MRSAIARALAHPSLWLAIIGFSFGNQPTRGESILDHVDIDQYYNFLISDVDRWNGGVEGVEGSIGMGAYEPGFDGLFRVNLDRAFRPINPNGALTLISQSRGILMNVEAVRASRLMGDDPGRFEETIRSGAGYLLERAPDPVYGGLYWNLPPDGSEPTTPQETRKHIYGHVHAAYALSKAYSVVGSASYLDAALNIMEVVNDRFGELQPGDPVGSPSAVGVNLDRTFSTPFPANGSRNADVMNHVFETLIGLFDVTTGEQRGELGGQIERMGSFFVERMFQRVDPTSGYAPQRYDQNWNPSEEGGENSRVDIGLNMEWAWLLSEAVLRGLGDSEEWINVGNSLINFNLEHGFDLELGAVVHPRVDYDGDPFRPVAEEDLIWWQQAELTKTAMHYAVFHDREELWEVFSAAQSFNHEIMRDPEFGGWYQEIDLAPNTYLEPTLTRKGQVWKVNFHVSRFQSDAIFLASAAVPEPTSILLTSVGMASALLILRWQSGSSRMS